MRYIICFTIVLAFSLESSAHYHLLLPNSAPFKVNEPISFTLKFGHPYEHEFHELSSPKSITFTDPEGQVTPIETFSKTLDPEKKLQAIAFSFIPKKRGAYLITVSSEPMWMEDEKEFYRDVTRVWVMVDSPKGWNRPDRTEFEILTRPFGLRAGMTVRGQFTIEPERPHLVEFEKYNPTPPKQLPPDEHITYATRTDKQGVFAGTLPEAGWWCITLTTNKQVPETLERNGKKYPVIDRHTIWVYVEEKIVTKPIP